MRREWTQALRERNWPQLERWIKQDADPSLATTLAEAADAFDAKPDRRAIKRLLFLLEQRGIRPDARPDAATSESATAEPAVPSVWLLRPGVAQTDFAIFEAETTVFRTVTIHGRAITRASQRSVTEAPTVSDAVPFPYNVFCRRFRDARAATDRLPLICGSWRDHLHATEATDSHPADAIPAGEISDADAIRAIVFGDSDLARWRLELGVVAPLAVEISQLTPENLQDRKHLNGLFARAAVPLATDEWRAEHRQRLSDLLWFRDRTDPDSAAPIREVRDELTANGADSGYVRALVEKTFFLFLQSLRAQREGSGQSAARSRDRKGKR
ncbi:MAG: hypothetical protein SFX74_08455 [Fimbriimonadaceae bacterium]|nr:hypothetical protein [Fimbriimonadaceae bacterium]